MLRVPAEWEPQQAVWIAWPHNEETWPGHYQSIPAFFANWARIMAESTAVRILADGEHLSRAKQVVGSHPNIEFVAIATNDCWLRDYGPTFVRDDVSNKLHAVDWRYNAWGGKYPPWDADDAAARAISNWSGIECVSDSLCLEGGAMETDGLGRMLTTPQCLVTESRNPGMTADDIARRLHARLGITEIVWVDGGGLEGDDTDGHIDQLARFIDSENVVVAVCDDIDDPNHESLESNYRQLKLWGSTTKPHVNVHRLPIPPRRDVDGKRVPESYCNFLMLGASRILLPTFGAPEQDDHALGLFKELRSQAEITSIDCRDLIWGLGALHCASRDQPAP